MERVLAHCDLNSFYASVECFYNPKIRHYPVAVCSTVTSQPEIPPNVESKISTIQRNLETRSGIILAKNQLAKSFGVKTGEAIWEAKNKCPKLVTVPANYPLYLRYSKLAKSIYLDYTDQVESFGIDENWCDLTGSISLFGNVEKITNEIKRRVKEELGITISVGVSYNKIFAKLGSDLAGINETVFITKDNFKDTIWKLPASDLLYVGHSTSNKLSKLGIKTIGDLANFNPNYLKNSLGKSGLMLYDFANGNDNAPVTKNGNEGIIKSIGNSITTNRNLTTLDDVKSVFFMLSESVGARLRENGLKCSTIQISVRDKSLFSCERQEILDVATYISSEIANKSLKIFLEKYKFLSPIRSLGVRGTHLVPANQTVQLDLFDDVSRREKLEKIEFLVDDVRQRFGYLAIQKGILTVDKKLTEANVKKDHTIHPVSYFN